ncbi:hypothetical protein QVD17_15311 [Tagetes erecta]|uniref:Uncharacterized protein n=1 Tax=Tagetes erecta TaxID=13708 RepID=A0AAD8NZK5_TARER|nr:hypothetical protein QVD17_15311 [Tagetes erecta]
MASSSNASRELQKELEAKANDLSKIQKGNSSSSSFFFLLFVLFFSVFLSDVLIRCTDISKNHQVRKKYTIQLGENELVLKELDLLNDDANVYKLIGPVLVKQDLAEANANVRKRIEYISAELKRLDSTLQDLEEKQNSKKEAIYVKSKEAPAKDVLKGLVEMCQMFHKSAEISSQILVLNMKGGLYLSGRCRCLSDTNAKPENYKSILEGVKENFLKVARVVWDRESKVIENNAFRDGDTVMDAVEFLLQNFSETNKLWVRMELQESMIFQNAGLIGCLFTSQTTSTLLQQSVVFLSDVLIRCTDISKNHQVRKKYTIQLGENELVLKELDLLNDDANVYKLIGPVLVKQDLAEANANVRKRIEYISAELKRLDSTLQDLEEKQNSKKEAIYVKSKEAPAKDVLKGLVEMCQMFHKSAEISSQILVLNMKGGLYLSGRCRCLSDTNAKPENYKSILEGVKENFLKVARVVWDRESKVIENNAFRDGDTVMDAVEFLLQNFSETNKLWVRMELQESMIFQNAGLIGCLFTSQTTSTLLQQSVVFLSDVLIRCTDISKNHQVRKKYTIQLGENELVLKELDLLNDDANVYKLIGPVLVKQDLAEANANVRKRIEYISAELKRLDSTLQDLEEKQNSKKEAIYVKSKEAPAKDVLKGLVEMCQMFHKSAEISSQILVLNMKGGLYLSGRCRCLSDTNAKPENYKSILEGVKENFLKVARVVWDRESKVIENNAFRDGDTVMDAVEFLLQNFSETNKLWVRMELQESMIFQNAGLIGCLFTSQTTSTLLQQSVVFLSDVLIRCTDISKNHQVRKKYTIQLGENELVLKELDLLNDDANVYKLIGPVLVKQDLAEANANVRKRIEYISAELKRLDSTLQDLEEKQNSKKEAIYVKSKEAPAKDVLKGLVEMCQMFHKSAEISSQILVLNMKGGLYLSGRCRCLSDTNAKPENYKSILEGVKENFLKVARVVWDRESKVIENNAFRDGDTVMDAVEFLLQNFSETNKLWVRMELQESMIFQNAGLIGCLFTSQTTSTLLQQSVVFLSDVLIRCTDISKNHQVRKKYTIQLGENELVLKELDLLNDDANVYKLIGPVLVKQDLAEANANVRKRIEYISAELKRLDSTLQDLEEKQNSKKEAIYVKSKEAPAKDVLKGLVEMCQMFHKSAEISSQILVLNMKGGLYLSGRCRCLSDTNAKPENYKSILEGVKENFLKVARVVWDRESKVIENNAFRDGDTVMDAVEFLLQNFSETNKLWVRMELQESMIFQNAGLIGCLFTSQTTSTLLQQSVVFLSDVLIRCTDISKNHQVRKKYTIQLGENELVLKELDLLNDDANVYKLIGPVLVKQDLAEANANVRKRIEYISAELKRLDSTLQDLEEKQNSKKEAIYVKSKEAPAKDVLKGLVEMCQMFHKSAEISSQILVLNMKGGLYLSGRCRCLSDTNAKPENYKSILEGVKENFLKVARVVWDRESKVIENNAFRDGDTVMDAVEFLLQNFSETNKLWVRMELQFHITGDLDETVAAAIAGNDELIAGEQHSTHCLLRAFKNRFGFTDELG